MADSQMTKSNQKAVRGFVLWMATFVVYGLFLLWAFLPESILHSAGVTYYPKKYWAVAIPAYLVMLAPFMLFSFIGINLINTVSLDSMNTVRDKHSRFRKRQDIPPDSLRIPEISDISIEAVNQALYADIVFHPGTDDPTLATQTRSSHRSAGDEGSASHAASSHASSRRGPRARFRHRKTRSSGSVPTPINR